MDQTDLDALLAKASRTFALTIPLLDGDLRRAMSIAYLLMRNADTLEDSFRIPRSWRSRALDHFGLLVESDDVAAARAWVARLVHEPGFDDPDHHAVLLETPRLLEALAALPPSLEDPIRRHVVRVARRMRTWVLAHDDEGRLALGSIRELDDYCYGVAGMVGELITELVEATTPLSEATRLVLHATAVDFGIGLQLVNILKDGWRDAQEGRRYVPWLYAPDRGAELRPERLRPLVDLALSRLDRGVEYTLALPDRARGVRLFCVLPLLLAAATLREVDARAGDLWSGEDVKIERDEVARLLAAAHSAVDDDVTLRAVWDGVAAALRSEALRRSA